MGILDGKVVLVTGAGRGVGRGHALTAASEGARVVVNDVGATVRGEGSSADVADTVVDIIRSRGGEAVADHEDIGSWDGARRAVHHAVDHFGALHGVVNNAGILRHDDIADVKEEDFDAIVRVHFKGTTGVMAHACAYWRDLARRGAPLRASVVNTISDNMLLAFPHDSIYGACKAAIASLTLASSQEGGEYGVRVNAYGPRSYTRMAASSNMLDIPRELQLKEADEYLEESPVNPANCAPLVCWLLSDQSLHVTGQVFRTLGGGVALCHPWSADEILFPPDGAIRFRPGEIGRAIDTNIFRTRFAKRPLDFAPGDPRRQATLSHT